MQFSDEDDRELCGQYRERCDNEEKERRYTPSKFQINEAGTAAEWSAATEIEIKPV